MAANTNIALDNTVVAPKEQASADLGDEAASADLGDEAAIFNLKDGVY